MEDKKKNNKGIYGVIIVLVIIAIIAAVYFLFIRNGNVNLDLNSISTSITSNGGFNDMATMDITKDVAVSVFNIPESDIEEVYGKMPMMNVQASLFAVIKAADGKADEVKQKLEEYGNSYQAQWEKYLPEQLELVKNRIIATTGDYVYIIIAENATELEILIK